MLNVELQTFRSHFYCWERVTRAVTRTVTPLIVLPEGPESLQTFRMKCVKRYSFIRSTELIERSFI